MEMNVCHNTTRPSAGLKIRAFSRRVPRQVLLALFMLAVFVPGAAGEATVRIGLYDNPPKVAIDGKGRPYGIFIDIINHIAGQEGWSVAYVPGTWDACLARLERGDIDLMPDVAYSEPRSRRFDFNRIPVLASWVQIFTREGRTVERFSDLNGMKIAVLQGSIQREIALDIRHRLGLRFDLIEKPDYPSTIRAIETGSADALIASRFYAYIENNVNLKPAPLILDPSTLHFAAGKGRNASLLAAIDRHLSAIMDDRDSIYYRSLLGWLHERPRSFIPRYVIWTLAAAGLVLLVILAAAIVYRRQVGAKTDELRDKELKVRRVSEKLRESEERVQSSLQEKERLIQELYHRTNNNMSVITSLLSLKSKRIGDPTTIKFARDMEAKIFSMALVHRMLYQSVDLSRINIKKYVDEFINVSLELSPRLAGRITFDINVEQVEILVDTAIPFGFVLNELLTNSYEHAFPDARQGTIYISIFKKKSEALHFTYRDDGIGVPDNFDFRDQSTFGLQMIIEVVEKQMRGTIDFVPHVGLRCDMEFPTTLYAARI